MIPEQYPDWMATVAFCAAAELVEKMLARRGLHSPRHEDRKPAVREHFPRILAPYHALYNAWLSAQSESMNHWLDAEEVRRELINRRLGQIREFAASQGTD